MKTTSFFLILFLAFSLSTKSQDLSLIIKQQATEMSEATVKGDYSLVIKYTYPKLIEFIGGVEKMKDIMTKGTEQMNAQGMTIEKVIIGEIGKIFVAGDELHCIIPEKITMKLKDGHLLINSNLLAVSKNKGKNWYFVDCNMGKGQLVQLFPKFNNELIIPEKQTPIKTND